MKDKSKLIAIVLVVITLVVVIITNLFKENESISLDTDIYVVSNYSNFYTVNSCLYRAISYISTKDKNNLFLLLSEDYKKENNITEDDVLSLFSNVESDSTFVSNKMYYQKLNNDITKYFVKGYIEKNQIFDDDIISEQNREEVYFIVYIDSLNKIFSIEPYDGNLFIEGVKNEK